MIFDRLGILTDEVSNDLNEALEWSYSQGLKHVEIRTVNKRNIVDCSDEEIQEVFEAVCRQGLFVSCIASPVFKCALDPSRPVASGDMFGQEDMDVEGHFKILERSIDIASILKTRNIRVFSFWREAAPEQYEAEIVEHLRRAATIAERANVVLLLENEPSCNGGYALEVAALAEKVNSPALKVLWDPGNEVYGGRSAFPEGYNAVKHTLGHVHIKDAFVNANGKPSCVPPGLGNVPFSNQFTALERDGYNGLFTLEPHYIPENGTAIEGAQASLTALKNLFNRAEMS